MAMTRLSAHWFVMTVLVTLCFVPGRDCQAQALSGSIVGTVRDSSHAVVPGVQITLTQIESGATQSTTSDESGEYSFAELKPAHYRLEASKPTFEKAVISDIELLVTQRQRLDITLRVGAATQQVEVNAGAAELLESQNAEIGQVIQQKPIVDLPLNGRDFIQLATLGAGIYPVAAGYSCSAQGFATGATSGTVSFTAMGLREQDISYLIDGIETRNPRWGSATIRPSPDAIQEFKVETQDYGSENGRSSVVVNIALKSGTDALHGSAYEFLRNSALDANSYFLNLAGVPKPGFQQNDFGASLGGPIRRGKTFFFGDYEGIRSLKAKALVGLYPSTAQLAGNLADDSVGTGIFPTDSAFCQSNSGNSKCVDVVNPSTGTPFPGNIIPTDMLNATAQKWLPYINKPNVTIAPNPGVIPPLNFSSTPKELNNADLFHIRVDHQFREKDHAFGSFSFDQRSHFLPGIAILGGEDFPWRAMVLSLGETHLLSSKAVNELHFGYSRSNIEGISQTANGPNIAADTFGIQNVPVRPLAYGIPTAGIAGFACIGSYPIPEATNDQIYQYTDNLTVSRGKQTLKAGGTVFHEHYIYICDCAATPIFSFSGQFSGASLGDFLLGTPLTATQSVGEADLNSTANFYAAYFEDDIRVRSNLTLNLGVRYEYQQSPQAVDGREETFLPSTGQEAAVFRGQIRNGIVKPNYNDWGPRIGIAYSPFSNTSIRSSYGIFYGTGSWNEFGFVADGPDFLIDQSINSNPTTPTVSVSNVFPAITLGPQNEGPNIGNFAVDPNNRTSYVQEWNLDVQRTFGNDWLVDVGYAGNIGKHLQQRTDENWPGFDPTGSVPISERRPFQNFSWILTSSNQGWSTYNGLLAKLERRVTSNSFLLAAYTWAKARDDFNPGYGYIALPLSKYQSGNSLSEVPQRFSLSYSYLLPFGQGRRFLSTASGFTNKLVSGWTVNGITSIQSGQYQTAYLPYDYANIGPFTSSLPSRVGPVNPAKRNYSNWWNSSAFALPGCPSLAPCSTEIHLEGDGVKGTIQNPGFQNWDISATKVTAINERLSFEFRAEFFNAFNHVQLGAPNSTLSSTFGVITTLVNPDREIQFGGKFLW
jgi:hypothetical protein